MWSYCIAELDNKGLAYPGTALYKQPFCWHEDIKTGPNSAQANNLVKVQAGYGERGHRMAFSLSLFNYPRASSRDQLRQEEPHAY